MSTTDAYVTDGKDSAGAAQATPAFPRVTEWIAYIAAVAAVWPLSVPMRGDDFGYYESVVKTIQLGVPTNSDWLEPYNWVLPSLAAVLWRVTGNFYAATFGILAGLAVINFVLMGRWLRPLLPEGWVGNVTVVGAALSPVLLNKTIDFTGVAFGWSCFLGALLAWRSRRRTAFFLCVLVGFFNRQSIVCLLAIPAINALLQWRRGEKMNRGWVAGLAITVVIIGSVVSLAPPTFARTLAAQRHASIDLVRVGEQAVLGLVLLGGIAACWSLLRGESGVRSWPTVARLASSAGWLALGCAVMLSPTAALRCETPGLDRVAPILVLVAAILAGVVPDALARVQAPVLAAVAAFAALVATRGIWWDYYLCEPALALACASPGESRTAKRFIAGSFALALAVVGLLWVYPLRKQVTSSINLAQAYERALRRGRIEVTQISQAPFGFLGWKLFPALLDEKSIRVEGLTDFLKYVDATASIYVAGQIAVRSKSSESLSLHSSGERLALPLHYRERAMPMDNSEWRTLIDAAVP